MKFYLYFNFWSYTFRNLLAYDTGRTRLMECILSLHMAPLSFLSILWTNNLILYKDIKLSDKFSLICSLCSSCFKYTLTGFFKILLIKYSGFMLVDTSYNKFCFFTDKRFVSLIGHLAHHENILITSCLCMKLLFTLYFLLISGFYSINIPAFT